MMNTLISPSQVINLAFGDGEPLGTGAVSSSDIAAAEQRYIVPVIGRQLYEKLLAGAYGPFKAEFLAAPVALFTRLTVQPQLDIRTGRCGTTAPRSDIFQPADDTARRRLMQSLRTQARTLLRRASDHLAAHRTEFPEYDPDHDISNRCSTDGNLVQTR